MFFFLKKKLGKLLKRLKMRIARYRHFNYYYFFTWNLTEIYRKVMASLKFDNEV